MAHIVFPDRPRLGGAASRVTAARASRASGWLCNRAGAPGYLRGKRHSRFAKLLRVVDADALLAEQFCGRAAVALAFAPEGRERGVRVRIVGKDFAMVQEKLFGGERIV